MIAFSKAKQKQQWEENMSISYKLVKYEGYKNKILELDGDVLSEHYEKNQENRKPDDTGECILCGKGIKNTITCKAIVATGGNMYNFIHKDDVEFAESPENKDGGFMGAWNVGPECFKKIKHIPEIKNYCYK